MIDFAHHRVVQHKHPDEGCLQLGHLFFRFHAAAVSKIRCAWYRSFRESAPNGLISFRRVLFFKLRITRALP